jgi:PAS domain S-box-containing protein
VPTSAEPRPGIPLATALAISRAIAAETDLDQLGTRLAGLAIDHAGATRARFVYVTEADTALPAALAEQLGQTRRSIMHVEDRTAAMWIPVHHGDRLLGALCLEGMRPPLDDHAAIAELIAEVAAVALAHAHRDVDRRILEEAQHLSRTGSFGWDPASGATVLSAEARTIFRVAPGVNPPRDALAETLHPEDRDSVLASVADAVAARRDWESDHRLLFPDGVVTHLHVVARAVTKGPDQLEYIGAIIDTTAARHAEESVRLAEQTRALRAANDRLELALRGSNVGVWDFDMSNGEIATAPVYSVNMWESLGYGTELPVSRWHPDRWHADDGPLLRAAIDAHLSGKTPEYELELRFRHVDGHYRWHLTRGRAQRRPDGTPHRFTGISIDLTEKKLLEQQLRHAKDAAETANRAKDMFVANVSHEIRTPMNVILGMTELTLDTQLTEDQRGSLSSVKSAAENLLVIIDELLDFAKMEAGKMELTSAPFELRPVLDHAMQAISVRARKKQLELTCEVADDVRHVVRGDRARLRQVLINLLDNAVKFTQSGEVRVRVERADADMHRFTVRDTGIGIAPEIHARIFQAFEQGDASTTKHYGGTGLGLTIAARLVALMEGTLAVVSTPGHGSTFTFMARLPEAVIAEERADDRADKKPESRRSPRAMRVLVAEDDELNEMLMRKLLDEAGHRVSIARSGREAVALAETRAFDVLLLDLHLPEMDGFAVVDAIRRHEVAHTLPRLPIIAATARSQRDVREACIAAGMDGFLGKPISRARLLSTLDAVVAHTSSSTLVDARTLLAACGYDSSLLATISTALTDQLPMHLHSLQHAVESNDLALVREIAHRICGLVAPFSTSLRDIAAELEDAAAERSSLQISESVERIVTLGPALVREVRGTTIEALRARL